MKQNYLALLLIICEKDHIFITLLVSFVVYPLWALC